MKYTEKGKLIAKLRKEAGYTQASLADALFITDKAVSKWERGLSSPDNSLLPKLAGLLDTDLASLLPDDPVKSDWNGLLILDNSEFGAKTLINGKPLLDYLLSYFLLLEITDVTIITDDEEYISSRNYSQYGFNISFGKKEYKKTFVVFGQTILFGAYLSRQLQNMMSSEEDVVPVIDGQKIPFLFSHTSFTDYRKILETAKYRSLYRGMINLPIDSRKSVEDADLLISIYEKYHHINFCNLSEIAKCRGITAKEK